MSALHLFVRRFVSDGEFRRLALTNPEAACDQYRLEAEDRRSVSRLCSKVSAQGVIAIGPTAFWL